ncbi:MAG TPA: VOC family protein [Ktedonobacterales bacterium]|nr:VOC family protein [Ktedonobacterales bacterium]
MTAKVRLGHVGVVVKNPKQSADFYHDLLGMEVTMEGAFTGLGDFVFLSDRPQEELQTLALATNPRAAHFAVAVPTLRELKAIYADAQARDLRIAMALNHRVTLSLYLLDPDANVVEVYWSTGQTLDRPYGMPVDLGKPESDLLDETTQPIST